jgi:hypothetical protein
MAVQGTSVFEDRFAARPLFGGAIMCCIPANFHVGFACSIILKENYSSSFCLCCFLHLFGVMVFSNFFYAWLSFLWTFVFHLVFSLFLVSNVQCSVFFPLCDFHELLSGQSCVRGCEDLVNQDQDLERKANFLNDCSISAETLGRDAEKSETSFPCVAGREQCQGSSKQSGV